MRTKKKKSNAMTFLEELIGGPLTLGDLLKAIREGEEWTLAQMGEKLGVSRGHVSNIEKGKPISPGTAARYARILGYDEDQFVRLAIEEQLSRDGLFYNVVIEHQNIKKAS